MVGHAVRPPGAERARSVPVAYSLDPAFGAEDGEHFDGAAIVASRAWTGMVAIADRPALGAADGAPGM